MKATGFCILLFLVTSGLFAQKYLTKTGVIRFYSDAPLEKIEAVNRQVNAALNTGSGDFVFRVLMKSFEFEKALMQEHFNENYVESDKYPNAMFVGKITSVSDLKNLSAEPKQVMVEGKLTLHGVTRNIREQGTLELKGKNIMGKATFNILLPDYKISVPKAVIKNVSSTIQVSVEVNMSPTVQ